MTKPTISRWVRIATAMLALFTVSSCALLQPAVSESPPPERQDTTPPVERPDDTDAVEAPPQSEPWRRLAAGQQSAVRVPLARAIASPEAWMDVWAALTANELPPPPRPDVDFRTETVIVLLLGERRTGGYEVRIAEVAISRNRVEVVVDVRRPEPGDMVTQALTAPYYIATIPVAGREIVFTGDDVETGFEGD